jgi:hypothetical protein
MDPVHWLSKDKTRAQIRHQSKAHGCFECQASWLARGPARGERIRREITFLRVWEKELLSAAFLVVSEGKSFGPAKLQLRTEPAD